MSETNEVFTGSYTLLDRRDDKVYITSTNTTYQSKVDMSLGRKMISPGNIELRIIVTEYIKS